MPKLIFTTSYNVANFSSKSCQPQSLATFKGCLKHFFCSNRRISDAHGLCNCLCSHLAYGRL